MYLVTAIRDIYDDENTGVEVAGIFDTEEKAHIAKEVVTKWLENQSYEDFKVWVTSPKTNRLAWYEIDKDIEEENDAMNNRINAIANFAQRRDDEIAAKKKQAEDREEFLKQTILGWSDRIKELIDTANACVEHGVPICYDTINYRDYDHNYFITDGCSHILGFEFNRCHPSTITRIGKEGGGCCHFNVYTDGKTITATGNDRLWALERFVEAFDEFETKFYAYVDKVCQSK